MDERDNNFSNLERVINVITWIVVIGAAFGITYLVWGRIF